jgi:hypothetical protein
MWLFFILHVLETDLCAEAFKSTCAVCEIAPPAGEDGLEGKEAKEGKI